MNGWFGVSWGAPVCDAESHEATPVGTLCQRCGEAICAGDDGFTSVLASPKGIEPIVFHYECQMRSIVGGLNHVLGNCTCCGGTEAPDPPGVTRREAARLACVAWEGRRPSRAIYNR